MLLPTPSQPAYQRFVTFAMLLLRVDRRMFTTRIEPSKAPHEDVLILVHGTGASRESGEGDRWWRHGSTASTELKSRLPDDLFCSGPHEVFHWSGENSERARIVAGRKLLVHLKSLEEKGQGYHLVGHSHGGSVIWHALQLATSQRKSLDHLRSWATVGTPFLQYRTRSFLNAVSVFNLVLAIALIKPALTVLRGAIQILGATLVGTESSVVTDVATGQVATSFWSTPVLRTAEVLGLDVSASGHSVHIGSFDSSGGQTLGHFLWSSPEGWLLLALALLVVYVYVNLAGFFLVPVLEAVHHRGERHLRRATMNRFAPRWLGIWSCGDEAINGLRATLSLSVSFVATLAPRERVLLSDNLSLLSRPYYWILGPLFNRLVRPVLDHLVRLCVAKTAQGNNRPATQVIEVSPTPIALETLVVWPPLPQWLDAKLEEAADCHARDIAPKLRRLLAAPSFSNVLTAVEGAISGRELIHTSYFDHAEVLDLLAMHMGRARGDVQWRSYRKTQQDDIVAWLDTFHETNLRAVGAQPAPPARTHDAHVRRRAGRRSRPTPCHNPPQQDAA